MQSAWEALERNDFRFAEAAAREALAASPADGEALYLLGSTLLFEGRFGEALSPLTAAFGKLARRGVAYRLGHCHLALGDLARAEEALRHEARVYPESANAHNTLGVALARQSRNDEALAEFFAAIRLEEGHGEANNNAGNALRTLGRYAEALPYQQRAVAAQPDSADALQNLGLTLHDLRRFDEAAAGFRRVLALEPRMPYALSSLVWSELHACDWRDIREHVAALRAGVTAGTALALPFTLIAVSDSPAEQRRCAELHLREVLGSGCEPLSRATRLAPARLRLAYLSADFHEHATAYLTVRLFELHDRDRFEVVGASYGPDDGSPMRTRLARAFDRFLDLGGMDDAQAALTLRDLGVDIAIDLKGHTGKSRPGILARRPAPLQVSYLGYPGTIGGGCIDYLLADRWVIPDSDRAFYSEQVVCLPGSYQAPDPTVNVAARAPSRDEAGLPTDAFVFCCFNDTYKITPALFAVWMALLAGVPGSVLWLLEPAPMAVRNLRREARDRGIDPARLVFAPRIAHAEHLARHRLADLFLDTLPCNAHTTASDALLTGLPVLTCLGGTFAGRVAASLLDTVGLPELITRSVPEYEALALKLAREPATLAAIRDRLRRNRATHPLFDCARTCRQIESAYLRMWETHRRGESPRGFSV
jgi:protein O-GlcNAc transferase